MTGFLFAFCTCVSLDFNSELFLVPYLCICLSAPRIPIDGLFFFLARACGPELLVDYSESSYNVPPSYRQPYGNGQSLSRRYCTHSGWLFSCATRTARKFHGALAVSCKYFKQSKWPYLAATNTHIRHIHHTHAQQDIRVCGDDHF